MFGLNIEECTTWMCINSFATWVSSFITIFISGTALFISIQAFRHTKSKDSENLSIKLNTCFASTGNGEPLSDFVIDVINIGHVKATVENYAWLIKPLFGLPLQGVTWLASNEYNAISKKLPTVLEAGEKAQYFNGLHFLEDFPDLLKEKNKFQIWLTIKSLKLKVNTTRNTLEINVPKPIKQLI